MAKSRRFKSPIELRGGFSGQPETKVAKMKQNCQKPLIKLSKYLQEELASSISYTTLYGDAASQQMSILLPNRFTILQPPPPLSTVLVLDGELEAVVDGLLSEPNPGILSG